MCENTTSKSTKSYKINGGWAKSDRVVDFIKVHYMHVWK
jgi:hypothetical protein